MSKLDQLERMMEIHRILDGAPDDTLMTSNQMADYTGTARTSAAAQRCRGVAHPPWIKIGDLAVRYRLGDLREFVRSRTRGNTTADPSAAAAAGER